MTKPNSPFRKTQSIIEPSFGEQSLSISQLIGLLDARTGGPPKSAPAIAVLADCRYERALMLAALLVSWEKSGWKRGHDPTRAQLNKTLTALHERMYLGWVPFAFAIQTIPMTLLGLGDETPERVANTQALGAELRRTSEIGRADLVVALVLDAGVRIEGYTREGGLRIISGGGVG